MTNSTQPDEKRLWSAARFGGGSASAASAAPSVMSDQRTVFETDYDRLLFSTPIRRMADKTQVFPLDRNDSVRTRLTHSHEVSNLARSIGNRLARAVPGIFRGGDGHAPIILATVGLAHDLGNPPFGHQGENAIRQWFKKNNALFNPKEGEAVPEELRSDFTNFEGNAQTLRLISKLQVSAGGNGLNLSAASLAALMKYTVRGSKVSRDEDAPAPVKKPGYFASEEQVIDWVRSQTGLSEGQRHPLTWLMEACDDMAYSVLDVEDAIKKGIVSAEDVLAFLKRQAKSDDQKLLTDSLEADFRRADEHNRISRANEIKASYLRTRLIDYLLGGAASEFARDAEEIFTFNREKPLLECGTCPSRLYKDLKSFAKTHAYNHSTVLRTELQGAIAVTKLLDWFWKSITQRADFDVLGSRRSSPFAAHVYALISENYRYEFEEGGASDLPIRYREMRLLTDMISGMTDSFAMELYKDLEPLSHD